MHYIQIHNLRMHAPNIFYGGVGFYQFLFAHSCKSGFKLLNHLLVGSSWDINPYPSVGSLKFVDNDFSYLELGTSWDHLRMTAGWQYLMVLLDALIIQILRNKSEFQIFRFTKISGNSSRNVEMVLFKHPKCNSPNL